jgi:mono/diheme cytochrome c family protein
MDNRTAEHGRNDMLKHGAIGIAAILLLAGQVAHADAGDARSGRAFALENCRQCHDVGSGGKVSSLFTAGPAFRDVANMPTTTPLSLFVFLTTSHPTMPNLMLSRKEIDDVISYIIGLRTPAPSHT